jgi:hypothetical protein
MAAESTISKALFVFSSVITGEGLAALFSIPPDRWVTFGGCLFGGYIIFSGCCVFVHNSCVRILGWMEAWEGREQ